jgi:hypothetical protein
MGSPQTTANGGAQTHGVGAWTQNTMNCWLRLRRNERRRRLDHGGHDRPGHRRTGRTRRPRRARGRVAQGTPGWPRRPRAAPGRCAQGGAVPEPPRRQATPSRRAAGDLAEAVGRTLPMGACCRGHALPTGAAGGESAVGLAAAPCRGRGRGAMAGPGARGGWGRAAPGSRAGAAPEGRVQAAPGSRARTPSRRGRVPALPCRGRACALGEPLGRAHGRLAIGPPRWCRAGPPRRAAEPGPRAGDASGGGGSAGRRGGRRGSGGLVAPRGARRGREPGQGGSEGGRGGGCP